MSDLLHTINNDAHSLSDHETLLRVKPGLISDADHQAWLQTIREWDDFFNEEVNRSLLGSILGASNDVLEGWQKRFDGWRNKIILWDAAGKVVPTAPAVKPIVDKNLPAQSAETRARAQTRKQEEKQKPPPIEIPTWVYLALGTALMASFGYTLASIARLGGK